MSGLQQWASGICILVFVISILQFFVPQGQMRSVVRLILGLFLLSSLITPMLALLRGDMLEEAFQLPELESLVMEKQTEDLILRQVKQQIVQLTAGILQESGYTYDAIELQCSLDAEQNVILERLQVSISAYNAKDAALIQDLLEEKLQIATEVILVDTGTA